MTTNGAPAGSHPEVIGDGGLLVSPNDPDALSEALRRVLTDTALADGLRERGTRQAQRYTWSTTATGIVPEDEIQSFLAFSHAEFITKRGRAWTPQEYQEWENFVMHYVPEAKAHGLDRNSLFLFFAEFCLQTVNLRKKHPQPEVKL